MAIGGAATDDDLGIRPLDARSLVLSVLLGLPEPELPGRELVALADVFDIAAGTMRVALSRMVASGELAAVSGRYRLVGRLLDRKRAQDVGRRPPAGAWDGSWWNVTVTSGGRTVAERRAFRTAMSDLRMGELRPETWMRPANLPGPDGDDGLVVVRGRLDGTSPQRLAERLWPLADIADKARVLLQRLDAAMPALSGADHHALPATIGLAAATVRFLHADPLLPTDLTAQPWPPDRLRARYAEFDRAFGRALRRALTGVRSVP